MPCNCFDDVNKKFAADNEQLVSLLSFDTGKVLKRALISLEKVKTSVRKPLRKLVASFCPFCGEKYEDPPASKR